MPLFRFGALGGLSRLYPPPSVVNKTVLRPPQKESLCFSNSVHHVSSLCHNFRCGSQLQLVIESCQNSLVNRTGCLFQLRWYTDQSSSSAGNNGGKSSIDDTHPPSFLRQENEDAIFLRNHPAYRYLFYFYDPLKVAQETKHIALKAFLDIDNPDEAIIHPKYQAVLETLVAALEELSEEEFQHCLYHLAYFPFPHNIKTNKDFEKAWKHFDDECVRRALLRKKWTADVNYLYADLWYRLRLARQSTFHWLFVKVGIRKIDKLPRQKFIRLCQCICKAKKLPKEIKLFNIEYNIPRIMQECKTDEYGSLTTGELSPICCIFWKSRSVFHDSSIANEIFTVCMEHTSSLTSTSVAAICKSIAISKRVNIQEPLRKFLEKVVPEVSRFDIRACTALLFLSKRHRVRNHQLMSKILSQVEKEKEKNLESFIPSDVQLIASAYETLDSPSSPMFHLLYAIIVESATAAKARAIRGEEKKAAEDYEDSGEKGEDYESETEGSQTVVEKKSKDKLKSVSIKELSIEEVIIRLYGRQVVPLLNSLAYGHIFPKKLISLVLSPNFLREHYGKSMHGYYPEILLLDQNVAGKLKGYTGHRLSDKAVAFLSKSYMCWVSPRDKLKVSRYESMCRKVAQSLENFFQNRDFVFTCNVIPHNYSIDIVMCTNKHNELVPVSEEYRSIPSHAIKVLDDTTGEKLQYHVILIHNYDMIIGGTDEPIGPKKIATQDIAELGYKTYEISYNSWIKFETEEERQRYLLTVLKVGGMKFSKYDKSTEPLTEED